MDNLIFKKTAPYGRMNRLLEKITELQRLKIKSISNLGIHVIAETTRQFPVFSVKNTSQGPVACINSANWEFAIFQLKASCVSSDDCEQTFRSIDREQFEAFKIVQGLIAAELPALSKLLGQNICTAIICELGSLKRLTEIPSKNLKGIGYVKSSFYNQRSYLSHHPLVSSALRTKDQNRKLRELCRMVSMTAKLCYFGGDTGVGTAHIRDRKKAQESSSYAQNTNSKNVTKVNKKRKGRGGRRKRKKCTLAVEEKHLNTRTTHDKGIIEDSTSTECDVSTE